MEKKKELANIALAALIFASAAPVSALIDTSFEAKETFLAAGCKSPGNPHGCASIADNAKNNDMYDTKNNAYQMAPAATLLTEAEILAELNPQAKTIYLSLDTEGKALVIDLANQDAYKDKNLAVKEAQRRMNERQGQMKR